MIAAAHSRSTPLSPLSTQTFSALPPVVIAVTGAAGNVAYSLLFMIARGDMYGPTRHIELHLLDVPSTESKLESVLMELEDLASPLLSRIVTTTDAAIAFANVDVAILVGSKPRSPGEERVDLFSSNSAIFRSHGAALEAHASRSVKVLIVGNPANTNAYIVAQHAPSLPRQNITSLMRLDHNRATALLAKRINANPGDIKGVIIWGNHSSTQYADARYAMREGYPRPMDSASVAAAVGDREWLSNGFVESVQQRGKAVLDKRGLSSAASAAGAIIDHMRDWIYGSNGHIVSMAVIVPSGGVYGVPEGLVFSLPCICTAGGYTIVSDLSIDDASRKRLDVGIAELIAERELAEGR